MLPRGVVEGAFNRRAELDWITEVYQGLSRFGLDYESYRVSYVSLQGYDPSRWPVGRRVDVAHPDHQNLVTDAACATGKRSVYIATD